MAIEAGQTANNKRIELLREMNPQPSVLPALAAKGLDPKQGGLGDICEVLNLTCGTFGLTREHGHAQPYVDYGVTMLLDTILVATNAKFTQEVVESLYAQAPFIASKDNSASQMWNERVTILVKLASAIRVLNDQREIYSEPALGMLGHYLTGDNTALGDQHLLSIAQQMDGDPYDIYGRADGNQFKPAEHGYKMEEIAHKLITKLSELKENNKLYQVAPSGMISDQDVTLL